MKDSWDWASETRRPEAIDRVAGLCGGPDRLIPEVMPETKWLTSPSDTFPVGKLPENLRSARATRKMDGCARLRCRRRKPHADTEVARHLPFKRSTCREAERRENHPRLLGPLIITEPWSS